MSLDQWDSEVRPYLAFVEADARWAVHYARSIAEKVHVLSRRPAWATNAEAALDDAEAALSRALETIRAARAEYEAKPVAA